MSAGSKQEIRERMFAVRRAFSSAVAGDLSSRVCGHILAALPGLPPAAMLAGYMATPGEVSLASLFRELPPTRMRLLLPRFHRQRRAYEMVEVRDLAADVAKGAFGICEPRPELPALAAGALRAADILWLVPGVAFDPAGHRLGRGAGYYDRLLDGARGVKIGVAFAWQVVTPAVPAGDKDVDMDLLVTENGVSVCAGAAAGNGAGSHSNRKG